ncbi:gamma-glutamylcyclotransferase family protein [Novosphingobium humi]|uniref:gamma-glutamylcyclotransferase family protein n=1 Tax=Novosphingobium humi TaxID=2282397 RepID=UPI0025B120FD|nr:gamma-glutamylcyclotransferase family protein [Novosphingobium humi]WJS98841.1 gamma-glutamylcyclotransferase [Novosphingobium humi]
MIRHFFFYGTLMAGMGNAVAREAHRHLGQGVAAHVAGALYALPDPAGWYPALLPGEGRVYGVVYPVLSGLDLAALDAYEGRDYRRVPLMVSAGAERIAAEAYLWQGVLPQEALSIPDGDFARWLGERGLSAYSA